MSTSRRDSERRQSPTDSSAAFAAGRLWTVLLVLGFAHSTLALSQQGRQREPRANKVAEEVTWPESVSPDGRLVAGWFTAGFAVRDLITGETRELTDEGYAGAPRSFGRSCLSTGTCVFSPDGDRLYIVAWPA
jgi:hypothetical protein